MLLQRNTIDLIERPTHCWRAGALSSLWQAIECNFRVRPLDEWKASI